MRKLFHQKALRILFRLTFEPERGWTVGISGPFAVERGAIRPPTMRAYSPKNGGGGPDLP